MDLSVRTNIVLAVYSVILTTIVVVRGIREKKRMAIVTISSGYITYGPELSKFMLFITIANPGFRTVTINSPQIKLPGKGNKRLFFPWPLSDVKFPHELEEGKDCTVWIEMEMLKRHLIERGYSGRIKLRTRVKDRIGNEYKTKKPWIFDLRERFD